MRFATSRSGTIVKGIQGNKGAAIVTTGTMGTGVTGELWGRHSCLPFGKAESTVHPQAFGLLADRNVCPTFKNTGA
jgi:hypothetical protein